MAKFSSVGDSSGLLSTNMLLAVFQIALWFFFGCRSESLLVLLVVGFDNLSYRQENIGSKFNKQLVPKNLNYCRLSSFFLFFCYQDCECLMPMYKYLR